MGDIMTGSVADGFQIGHLIAQDSIDLFNTGYSVYQDQRNYQFSKDVFDYNKALQQEIFNREDTAYERKRRDLERAGLNPNLAAGGSGSGAGAIVGNSNQAGDHQLYKADLMRNLGAYLDARMASEKIKQTEYENFLLDNKYQNDKLNFEQNSQSSRFNRFYNDVQGVFDSNMDPDRFYVEIGQSGDGWTYPNLVPAVDRPMPEWENNLKSGLLIPLKDSRVWQELLNGYHIGRNDLTQSDLNTQMLSRENDFQTSDKWFDRGFKIFDRIFNGANVINNFRNSSRQLRRRRY